MKSSYKSLVRLFQMIFALFRLPFCASCFSPLKKDIEPRSIAWSPVFS